MKNAATEAIERDFPDWLAWQSRQGHLWGAVRRAPRPYGDPTIIADSEDELRAALSTQPTSTTASR